MGSPVQAAVQAMTADELLAQIAKEMPQQPGESLQDFFNRINLERVVREAEMGIDPPAYNWTYEPGAQEAFDKVVRETTADGAWKNWTDGAKTAQGAAAPEPVAKAAPGAAIKKSGEAGASLGGLLSMSLPTWVAAAAPLLGVAVGVGLYELSPEFWTKVSKALLPWCYEDTQVMPVVMDRYGNTYIDKEALEELEKVFKEEGIGGETGRTSELETGWDKPIKTAGQILLDRQEYGTKTISYFGNSAVSLIGTRQEYVVASASPGEVEYKEVVYSPGGSVRSTTTLANSYTYDGKTVYYTQGISIESGYTLISASSINTPLGAVSAEQAAKVAWTIVYGTQVGKYVPGTSKWDGVQVDISELPITEVYTDPTKSDTRDFIPVALPTSPGQSVSAETNPDPTVNSDPEAQISPYINPSIGRDQYPSGSDSTGDEGQKLDDSAPIPLPYPPTPSPPNPDDNPSDEKKTKPQHFVDIIPPIDSGDVDFSPLPSFGAPTDGGVGGLVSIYNPTYSELQSFSQWLWVTYQDATIDKIWNNPFDGIISLYEIYCTPTKGARKYIKSGFLVSPVECITIPQRYIEINCGTAVFPEYYGNYLDYSPYSKALCYLPFIGVMELNVDDIVGHAVNITYRVDTYTGGCIAVITCAREGSNVALYQFSGNCSVQLPIAGGTQASIRAAQMSASAYQNAYHQAGLAGFAGGLASAFYGGANFITGPVSGIAGYHTQEAFGAANSVSQTVAAKSSVQHSGQFGESYGAMGHKKPYMIIKRPVQVIVPGYQQVYGFQAHKMVQIGACTGFLRCRAVHVVSAQASDDEKSLIEKLLVSGVYVTEE